MMGISELSEVLFIRFSDVELLAIYTDITVHVNLTYLFQFLKVK